MNWRYGLSVRKLPNGEDLYEVREFYENLGGKTWGTWTENPIYASGNTRKEVIEELELMLEDVKKHKAIRIDNGENIANQPAIKGEVIDKQLDKILDDYYAPIIVGDSSRKGLKKEIKKLFEQLTK